MGEIKGRGWRVTGSGGDEQLRPGSGDPWDPRASSLGPGDRGELGKGNQLGFRLSRVGLVVGAPDSALDSGLG